MDIRDYLNRIKASSQSISADADAALALLPSQQPPSSEVFVPAGGSLQAALDKGGNIRTEAGATYAGNFVAKVPGTRLTGGLGSALAGPNGGPALFIAGNDIGVSSLKATTEWDQSCIMLGLNDPAQNGADAAPKGIVLSDIKVPRHRGKKAIEINAAQVLLQQCSVDDAFDPGERDSQAICILNTPGDIRVQGGSFSAGSEVVLVGGAGGTQAEKIVPQGLTFDGVTLFRPLGWLTDGVYRKVKTTFELKTGRNVTLKNSTLDGVWKQGQDGYAITITPRNFGDIRDVLIDTCTLKNCGSGLNIIGADDEAFSPPLQRVKLARVICLPNAKYGAGRFVQMGGACDGFELEACEFDGPDSIILSYANKAWDSPTNSHLTYVSKGVKLSANKFVSRSYGLMLTGAAGAGAYGRFWKEAWPDGVISGNTFSGPTGVNHKPNLPSDNFYAA